MMIRHPRSHVRHGRRGFVLITVMWIAIALTAVVLVLGREMQVEHLTASQHLSQAKADAAEIGVEQYVCEVIEQEGLSPGYKDTVGGWEQRELGDCYFWVLTPKMVWSGDSDETSPRGYAYGITDEASKLDINYVTEDMLDMLPNLYNYPNISAAMMDWRDFDDTVTVSATSGGTGEESDYYDANYGYRAKNSNFENLDELRLVAGLTASEEPDASMILWGGDLNHNGVIDLAEQDYANQNFAGQTTMRGIMPYITVWGYKATNPAPIPGADPTVAPTPYTDPNTGITTPPAQLTDITYLTPLDINTINPNAVNVNTAARNLLTQLFQQYAPAKAGGVTTALNTHFPQGGNGTVTPFINIWQFILEANLTSDDLSAVTSDGVTPLFCLLTCNMPPPAAADVTAAQNAGTPVPPYQFAKLNLNTASEQALMCIPGFTQADADAIIEYRQSMIGVQDPAQVPNISWVLDVLSDPTVLDTVPTATTTGVATTQATTPAQQASLVAGSYITGQSTVFSAEIVTASKDGRAFKRVKVVVDDTSGSAVIVYRRDMTDEGWPLPPELRDAIKEAYKKGVPLSSISPPLTGSGITGGLMGQ